MDVVAPIQRSDLNAATAQLFVLDWYTLVLYPQGAAVDEIPVEAQLRLPQGWKHACAMTSAGTTDGVVKFQRTSLRTLVDSPVLAGKNFTTLELRSGLAPPFYVDIAAEKPEMAALSPEWQDRFRRLVTEAGALFGGYPHEQYHFLIALSDEVGNDGLEHRQSSDIRMSLRSFSDDASRLSWGYLVPHEYVHSWNGTFRVPAGSIRRDYQQRHNTELHWVYAKTTTDVISPGHLGKTFHVHKPESGGEWPPVCLRTMIGFGTPLQSTAETQPQLHPALLSLSAIIGEYKKTHPSVRSTVGLRTITLQARRLG